MGGGCGAGGTPKTNESKPIRPQQHFPHTHTHTVCVGSKPLHTHTHTHTKLRSLKLLPSTPFQLLGERHCHTTDIELNPTKWPVEVKKDEEKKDLGKGRRNQRRRRRHGRVGTATPCPMAAGVATPTTPSTGRDLRRVPPRRSPCSPTTTSRVESATPLDVVILASRRP